MVKAIGAALKAVKIMLTDPNVREKIGKVMSFLIAILIFPIFCLQLVFGGDGTEEDYDPWEYVAGALDEAQQNILTAAENQLILQGLSDKIPAARVLLVFYLDFNIGSDLDVFINCFEEDQTYSELTESIKNQYGIEIDADELEIIVSYFEQYYIDNYATWEEVRAALSEEKQEILESIEELLEEKGESEWTYQASVISVFFLSDEMETNGFAYRLVYGCIVNSDDLEGIVDRVNSTFDKSIDPEAVREKVLSYLNVTVNGDDDEEENRQASAA